MSIIFDPYDIYIPRNTSLALSLSLIAHAVVFSVAWKWIHNETPQLAKPKLSIVLVNRKTLHAPKNATTLAQADLDADGRPEQIKHVARTTALEMPLPNTDDAATRQAQSSSVTSSDETTPTPSKNNTDQQNNSIYLTRPGGTQVTLQPGTPRPLSQTEQEWEDQSTPLPNIAGKLSKTLDTGQEGRGSKVLGASTREYRFAGYLESWRHKVEQVGSKYYQSVAGGKRLYGVLVIKLRVHSSGVVENVKIERASGDKELVKIAKEIVRLASPFDPFPDALRAETPIMEITRTYTFHKGNVNGPVVEAGEN